MAARGDLRIVLVGRDFWPSSTDDSLRLQWICHSLLQHCASVTVLTYAADKSWPSRLQIGGIDVWRVSRPAGIMAQSALRAAVASITSAWPEPPHLLWLDDNSALARSAASTVPTTTQVIVRHATQGTESSDAPVHAGMSRLLHRPWRSPPQWLVASLVGYRQLVGAGIARQSIQMLAPTCSAPVDRSIGQRRELRRAMAEANHELFLRGTDRLVVGWVEDCHQRSLERTLWQLGEFAERHKACRIWIMPTGDEERRIHNVLQRQGWHRLLTVPGCFADPRDLLQIADLGVLLVPGRGLGWYLPWALGSGIPMLAPDSPDFRAILDAAWKQSCSAASQAVAASGDNSPERTQPGYLLGFSDEPGRTIATKLDAWWQDNHSLQQVTDLLQRGLVNRFWGDALWALLRNAATASSVVDSA